MLKTFSDGKTPAYKITKVSRNYSANVAAKVEAELKVPNYLNTELPIPSSRLVLDDTGLPVVQVHSRFETVSNTCPTQSLSTARELCQV
jgi:hypothetical protein